MPTTQHLIATLAFLTALGTSIPFRVQEQCFCELTNPSMTYHNETLAACEDIAAKIQSSRASARKIPLPSEAWIMEHTMNPSSDASPKDAAAPYTNLDKSCKVEFESAMRSIRKAIANKARHQHSSQMRPPRRNPPAPAILSQELRRRSLVEEQYNIICRGVVYSPSTSSKPSSTEDTEAATATITYIGFRPIPVLFIFLAMVLACTTIIEATIDAWSRYFGRIRLNGVEQALQAHPAYADVATMPSIQETDEEAHEELEKRAEAQLDGLLRHA